MMEKRTKVKNGVTYTFEVHSATIEFTDATKRQELLSLNKAVLTAQPNHNGLVELPRSTLLIGDRLYNNVFHPWEEMVKSYQSLNGQPFVIDHKDGVLDEVGFMKDAEIDPATKRLTAIPVLNLNTDKGYPVLHHMQNRVLAGKSPETSVAFWAIEKQEKIPLLENSEHVTARDWEFDHNSSVYRGAGSPSDGIGIGLSQGIRNAVSRITGGSSSPNFQTHIMNPSREEPPMPDPTPPTAGEPPQKFTMSKDEFRAMMKEELAQQAAEQEKQRQEASKSKELEDLKAKLDDANKKLATRTTATRDNTDATTRKVMDARTKEIRKQVIGAGIIKFLQSGEGDLHIRYHKESMPGGEVA